jgi:hypothetical protein
MVAAGVAMMVAGVAAASGGRAVESWLASGFAGAGLAEWAGSVPAVLFSQVIGPSRVFAVVLLAALAAWLLMLRDRGHRLLVVQYPVTIAATALVLASPGTSYTNQLIDASAMSIVVIGSVVARRPRALPITALVLALLSLAAARQSLRPVTTEDLRVRAGQLAAEREALVREIADTPGPVLSESPELLVLAGCRPYLLDPFMLRVLAIRRPELLHRLDRDLDARRFSRVILMFDPDGRRGRGWYENVDFGWPVMSSILANYEFSEVRAGLRVYRPRARAPQRPSVALD